MKTLKPGDHVKGPKGDAVVIAASYAVRIEYENTGQQMQADPENLELLPSEAEIWGDKNPDTPDESLTDQAQRKWTDNKEYHRTVGPHRDDPIPLTTYPDMVGTGDIREYPQPPKHQRRRSEQ